MMTKQVSWIVLDYKLFGGITYYFAIKDELLDGLHCGSLFFHLLAIYRDMLLSDNRFH